MTSSAEPSPISPRLVVSGAVGISEVVTDGDSVYWAESRPDEGGRTVIVGWTDGESTDVSPAGVDVRTRVHEYGGGAWWVSDGRLLFSDDARGGELFLQEVATGSITPLTSSGHRYADGRPTGDGRWYVAVRERHDESGVHNEIVRVATDGSGAVELLHSGHDFYASPRISPEGSNLVAVCWDQPDMPWDRTRLLIGPLGPDGWDAAPVPDTGDEALANPDWSADGRLLVVTDVNDWWNLVELDPATGQRSPVVAGAFEVATPAWVFGLNRWVDTGAGLVAATAEPAGDRLLGPDGPWPEQHSTISSLRARPDDSVVYAAASFTEEPAVWVHDGVAARRISRPRDLGVDPSWLPSPEPISFPAGGSVAHALYYPPTGSTVDSGRLPALRVHVHGGPTGAARRQLQLTTAFWTSRGVAVVDVDYRGSTLYGREYRRSLFGGWGEVDVIDCVAAARHLADAGRVDPARLVIAGGSAGGLTVLNALIHHDVFSGGICRYGVTDLAALATDTHKFEARYLDRLVGELPADADVYAERSPVGHVDRIAAPMLVMQGLDDAVVPPSQSEAIVAALEANGVPVTYLEFAGEGHGFRSADTIVAALEAELEFIESL